MAAYLNRNKFPVAALQPELVPIAFSFAFNGNSTPALTSIKGMASSVTLSDTGTFTASFNGGLPDIVAMQVSAQSLTANNMKLAFGAVDTAAGTVQILAYNTAVTTASSAALFNPAASSGNRANVTLWVKGTGVSRP